MCGISGFYSTSGKIDLSRFYEAHKLLSHRGPDDEGFVLGSDFTYARGDDTIDHFAELPHLRDLPPSNLVLGNRRLKILDLSWHGHQPMTTADKRFATVFNGEIFNYKELAKELSDQGHNFTSSCDTEVMLAAFAQQGPAAFDSFNGMWAAAFFDRDKGELILCRDRFGIKPLFYTEYEGGVLFASEIKSLLPFKNVDEVNEKLALDFLIFSTTDHERETLFAGIKQVRPGHFLKVTEAGVSEHKWWDYTPQLNKDITYEEAQKELYSLFSRSIDLRLRSDVPVGVALSGGLDSTSIACEIARKLPENNDFHAFSAVYEEAEYSERQYVEDTIKQTHFTPHWISPSIDVITKAFQNVLYHQELPFCSLAIMMQWFVMEEARKGSSTVVMLEGQGSDEIFGGYTNQLITHCTELIRSLHPWQAFKEAKALVGHGGITWNQAFRALVKLPIRSALGIEERYVTRDYLREPIKEPMQKPVSQDLFVSHLFSTLTFRALPEYLRYSDRNSMAFSLESRLPFMDYKLVEWAFTLPNTFKAQDGVGKMVLRDTMRPHIPQAVTNRSDKMGFTTPQAKWQRNRLRSFMAPHLTSDNLSSRFSFIDGKKAQNFVDDYLKGINNDMGTVWRLFCLSAWHEMWIDNKGKRPQ